MNPPGTPGRAAAGPQRFSGPPPYANSVGNDEDPTMIGSDPRPGALRLLTSADMSGHHRPSVIPSAVSDAASASVTHDVLPPASSPRYTADDWAERERKFDAVESKKVSFDFADIEIPPLATTPKKLSSSRIDRFEMNRKQIAEASSLPPMSSISPVQRAYHPSTNSLPYQRMHEEFAESPGRPGSASTWTPNGHSQEYARPPSSVQYELEHINGSPRPGTPSGRYSNNNSNNNNKRPLPPAPLFAGATRPDSRLSRNEDGMTNIHIEDDDDDVFAEFNNDHGVRGMRSHESFQSENTFADEDRDYSEDEDDEKVKHIGPAPEGPISRRGNREVQMTKKEVHLVNGELILECKIPTTLHSFLPHRGSSEFTHMRYTAVTCDPDDFVTRGFKLRQNYGSTLRETELFICITMYNEDEINFTRTMHGVMRNIMHFCSRTKSRTWGKDGWQKIVVCIISDGRSKVHPRTLDALAAMGVYQPGIAKNQVNQKEVTAHVYEYTTQISLNKDLKFKSKESGIVPCQMIFCLKEKNQKKLNSHRWFFNAFGRALNPNICILLDVGTKPEPTALYHLWKAFDNDSSVAGAAGEIIAGKGKGWLGLLNPLVASQNFEYKMSNILDKPLESVFGYITVLPGALSAYRYIALQNDENGHGPLSQYFKGETLHGQDADVFTANMYLAEDRILCWELVAKRNEHWVLKFVKRAKGETDVPDAIPEFISQRRRWLNGAFFAAVYSLLHFKQVWTTDHSFGRKFMLHIEFIYQFINLMFTFFSLANFYLTFYFIAGSLADPKMDPFGHHVGHYIFLILRYLCVLVICVQFILSMGNRPQGAPKMYMTSMVIYGIIMAYTTFAALYIVVIQLKSPDTSITIGNNVFTNLVVSTASTIGIYFLMSFLYLDPWHMFTSSAQYFALLPSYICTLQVYAFCNTHDVSWGTKGDNVVKTDLGTATGKVNSQIVELDMPTEQRDIDTCYDEALFNLKHRVEVAEPEASESQKQEDYYRAIRTYMVIVWLIANAVLAMAISEAYSAQNAANNFYLKFILWSVAIVALFRAVGSTSFAVLSITHSIAEAREKWSTKWEGSSWGSGFGASSSGGQGGRIGADGNTVVSQHRSKLKRPSTFSMPKMSMPSMPNLHVEKPMWLSNAGGWMKRKVPGMGG